MIKCRKCNTPNDDDAIYCKYCGERLEKEETDSEMIRCKYCGLLQPSDNHYCISCGTTLYPKEYKCSFCGYPLDTSWEYCPMCGVSLKTKRKETSYLLFEGGYKLWLPPEISEEGVEIGREKIPKNIDEDSRLFVSKRHFKIYVNGGNYMIVDLDSTNGTMVDGNKIEPMVPMKLEDGSKILIAERIMAVFKEGDENGK